MSRAALVISFECTDPQKAQDVLERVRTALTELTDARASMHVLESADRVIEAASVEGDYHSAPSV